MCGIGLEPKNPGIIVLARQMHQMHFWNEQVLLRIGQQAGTDSLNILSQQNT